MANINNQTKTLNDIADVQELSSETAATVQGGAALEVYRHAGGVDWLGGFNFRTNQLSSNANNQISSVRVREGRWRFFNWPNRNRLGGFFEITKPGLYNIQGGWNDQISSLERF